MSIEILRVQDALLIAVNTEAVWDMEFLMKLMCLLLESDIT